MSDVMLLGVLRMPMPDEPDTLTLRQFVDRAREAADRIEADADELARLRAEAASFQMAYRLKCDEETKAQAMEILRLRTALETACTFARDIQQHVADVLPEA